MEMRIVPLPQMWSFSTPKSDPLGNALFMIRHQLVVPPERMRRVAVIEAIKEEWGLGQWDKDPMRYVQGGRPWR